MRFSDLSSIFCLLSFASPLLAAEPPILSAPATAPAAAPVPMAAPSVGPSASAPVKTAEAESPNPAPQPAVKETTSASFMHDTLAALSAAMDDRKKPLLKDYSLKDRVTKALRESEAAAVGAATISSRTPGQPAASPVTLHAQESGASLYGNGGAAPAFGGGSSLSLDTAESDAQVEKMIDELSQTETAEVLQQSAELAHEGISLFTRVSHVYRKIHRRL